MTETRNSKFHTHKPKGCGFVIADMHENWNNSDPQTDYRATTENQSHQEFYHEI